MKKFFSAFLLMTAMVLSVGTFVACNDLTEEMETVQTQATSNAAAVKALGDQITALQTALATAQSTADAAKKAGDEAKAAAAQAKADAIAEAKAECEIVKKALETKIAEVEAALAGKASKAELDAAIAEATKGLKALETALGAKIAGIEENLNKLASKEDLSAEVAKLLAADKELALQIAALKTYSDTTYATAAEAEAIRAELTKLAEEHYSELYKLIGTNASAIQAVVDTVDVIAAALQELIGANTSNINELAKSLAGVIETADSNEAAIAALEEALAGVLENNAALAESVAKQIVETNEYLDKEIAELAKADAANQELINTVYNALTLAVEDLDAELKAEIAEVAAGLEALDAKVAGLQEQINAINKNLNTIASLKDRLQSVSYVPEWIEGLTAYRFEGKEYGYVHMSFEVAPKEYAEKITAENAKLVGVALTKAVEVAEYEVKILNADAETGIVEVLGYIPTKATVWNNDKAALALRVVAEDAQFTSAYTEVKIEEEALNVEDAVFFGIYDEDGKFVYGKTAALTIPYTMPYNTAVAESEVALFEGVVARVALDGFFEDLELEAAEELLDIEIEVTEQASKYATKFFVTENPNHWTFNKTSKKKDTPAFEVTNDETLDITVKFNKAVVDSLKTAGTYITEFYNKTASAEIKPGYFLVNGEKPENFMGIKATYTVVGLEESIELILNNDETLAIEWSTENYDKGAIKPIEVKDIDVTGGDARHLVGVEKTLTAYDANDEAVENAPTVKVKFISIDNADVTVSMTEWPAEALTYTYKGSHTYTDKTTEATKTDVTVKFDLTVAIEAAPEQIGEVPVSDELNVVLSENDVYKEDPTKYKATEVPLTGVVEALLPYYEEYFETEEDATAEIKKAIDKKAVRIYYSDPTTAELIQIANAGAKYIYSKTTGKPEASKITINYNPTVYGKMKKQYVQFQFDVVLFGIKATVTADCAEVSDWKAGEPEVIQPYTLEAVNTYSMDLTTTGVAPFTINKNAVYRYYTVNETTGEKEYAATMPSSTSDYFKEHAFDYWKITGNHYGLYKFGDEITVAGNSVKNAVNLMKYFKLVQKENTTVTFSDYVLVAELDTFIPKEAIDNAPKIAFAYTSGNLAYPSYSHLFKPEFDEEGEYIGNNSKFVISNPQNLAQLYLDWNGFKNYDVTVTVSLVKNYNPSEDATETDNEICGSRTIALTHSPIVTVPATADNEIVVYYDDIKANATIGTIELAKGVRVYAADGESPLYNLAATAWTNVFASYKPTSESTFATEETKSAEYQTLTANYFNTTLGLTANFVNELDEDGEPIANKYQYTTTDSDFYAKNVTFDATNGQLVITHDATLNLAQDITITIPVEIGHMFTYTGEKSAVKVVIKPGHAPQN